MKIQDAACPSLEDVCRRLEAVVLDRFVEQVAVVWSLTIVARGKERGLFCIPRRVNYGRRRCRAVRRAERKHDLSLRVAKDPDMKGDETERY